MSRPRAAMSVASRRLTSPDLNRANEALRSFCFFIECRLTATIPSLSRIPDNIMQECIVEVKIMELRTSQLFLSFNIWIKYASFIILGRKQYSCIQLLTVFRPSIASKWKASFMVICCSAAILRVILAENKSVWRLEGIFSNTNRNSDSKEGSKRRSASSRTRNLRFWKHLITWHV